MSTNRPRLFERLKDGLEELGRDARGEINLPVTIIDTDNLVKSDAVKSLEAMPEYSTPVYTDAAPCDGVRESNHQGAKQKPAINLQQMSDNPR